MLKSSACMTLTYLTWGRDFPYSCHSRASFFLVYLAVSRQLRDDIAQPMTILCLNHQRIVVRLSDFRVKRPRRDGDHWSSSNTWISNTFTLFHPPSWHWDFTGTCSTWSGWPTSSTYTLYRVQGYCCTWSYSDTLHSIGVLWTGDQPDAETSTWQHTTLTRDRHPCLRRDSIPQSQ